MIDDPEDISARREIAATQYVAVLPPVKTCADGAHRMRRDGDGAWRCACGANRRFPERRIR